VPMTLMEAMARQEGFLVPGSLPQRRNNPGDVEEGRFAREHGALATDGHRFAAWPTPEAGWAAMRALLVEGYVGLTVAQALDKWAPPEENDDGAYLRDVLEWTGLRADTILSPENIG